jgi:LysR family transcriptional regulator (chromosome initiation inhibitor)
MLDYRGLEALYTVLQMQSFEEAAKKLHITQSAVSQRLRTIEQYFGEPLLIRLLPYQATEFGDYLLSHFKRIRMLEDVLSSQLTAKKNSPNISIAISRDCLETWFMEIIEENDIFKKFYLEISADDQEVTLQYLKKGLVSACVSTANKPIPGCKAIFLGYMDYILVASPKFKEKYFSGTDHKANLINAPAVIFDLKDKLHDRYLKYFFNIDEEKQSYHRIPSVKVFKQFTQKGYAYGLIPKIDIIHELKTKQLIALYPTKIWEMPIYWHCWTIEPDIYKTFNNTIITKAQLKLRQK